MYHGNHLLVSFVSLGLVHFHFHGSLVLESFLFLSDVR